MKVRHNAAYRTLCSVGAISGIFAAVLVAVSAAPAAASSPGKAGFDFTGSTQTWRVPDQVGSLDINATGGAGANGGITGGIGSAGANLSDTAKVLPGDVLRIDVGGAGGSEHRRDGAGPMAVSVGIGAAQSARTVPAAAVRPRSPSSGTGSCSTRSSLVAAGAAAVARTASTPADTAVRPTDRPGQAVSAPGRGAASRTAVSAATTCRPRERAAPGNAPGHRARTVALTQVAPAATPTAASVVAVAAEVVASAAAVAAARPTSWVVAGVAVAAAAPAAR